MSPSSDKTATKHLDNGLLIVIFVLLGFGIVMQFSASYAIDPQQPYYYIIRHLVWVALGLASMFVLIQIDYHVWQKFAIPIMGLALLLLIVTFLIAKTGPGGGKRHLLTSGSIQPSELAKLAIFIYIAAWLASKEDHLDEVTVGLLPFSILLGVFLVAILLQPDISTSVLIALTAVAMLIIAGADLLQIGILLGVMGLVFTFAIFQHKYATKRLAEFGNSFLAPWNSPNSQVQAGYAALHRGGLFGKGLGNSIYKLPEQSLPAIHSDIVFAVIGEELGLLGALAVIALFLFLAYKGTRIALNAPDSFGRFLAFGITTWIVLQAFINIAVVTVTIPNTGIPLPFISYGGSSLVTVLAGLGILLNISKEGQSRFSLNANSSVRRRNRRSRVSYSHRRRRT
jgi:cell division protein FtsW